MAHKIVGTSVYDIIYLVVFFLFFFRACMFLKCVSLIFLDDYLKKHETRYRNRHVLRVVPTVYVCVCQQYNITHTRIGTRV